jgi:uncharacterized membrane protein (DUF4010 family)
MPFAALLGLSLFYGFTFEEFYVNLTVKEARVETHLVSPTAVLLAYGLGPFTLTQPLRLSIALVVAAVLLIGSRRPLHRLVGVVPQALLGGLYSSAATTAVLARKGRDGGLTRQIGVGMIAATGMMYVRLVAQNPAAGVGLPTAASAIMIASSSNNVLKAVYAIAFSHRRESLVPASMLVAFAVPGAGAALVAGR